MNTMINGIYRGLALSIRGVILFTVVSAVTLLLVLSYTLFMFREVSH